MSSVPDRLRSNLRGAGIRFDESEISELEESGMLQSPIALDRWSATAPSDGLPDPLDATRMSAPEDLPTSRVVPDPSAASTDGSQLQSVAMPETIAALAPLLARRALSPVELVDRVLERIEARDLELNVFHLVLAGPARAAASRAEREIAKGNYRGVLHGIPVAVKDLLAMKGLPNAAGSRVLADWTPDFDAAAVERLEAAGAVIVGRTRMPEFAYSPGSNNPHYGPTRNPWNPEHDAGGSSSGSAVAVAVGMAVAALGSDTGGSIRIPAAHCGIVGLKPTFGRVSLHGAVPLSWSLDHLGPMTRTVEDAAILFAVLAGRDPRDPRTVDAPFDASTWRAEGEARRPRVGVVRDDGSGSPLATEPALAAWRRGLNALASWGAVLVEIDVPEIAGLRLAGTAILALEAASHHQRRLREQPERLGGFLRRRLLAAHAYGPDAYVRAQQLRAELRRSLTDRLAGLDLLSTPTLPAPAPSLGTPSPTLHTLPFNVLGWPAVTLPVGVGEDRLPLGMQLVARPWQEALLLRAAARVEVANAGEISEFMARRST